MNRRRYWPGIESRWWSVCVLAVFTLVFIGLAQLLYLLVYGTWMPWR